MSTGDGDQRGVITCSQLVTRFDRNGERVVSVALLRQVRACVRHRMQQADARGPFIWRLTRTRDGLVMAAVWHPRAEQRILTGLEPRRVRREQHRRALERGVRNRRRLGSRVLAFVA